MLRSVLLVVFLAVMTAGLWAQTPYGTTPGTAPNTAPTVAPDQPAPGTAPPASVQQPTYNDQSGNSQTANPQTYPRQPLPPSQQFPQRQTAPAYPAGVVVPAGTTIRATLDTPLSTKTSQVGDRFTATVSEPVRDGNGQVTIPVGSKINGQVANSEEGKAVAILRGKGRLDLHFVDMTLPAGVSTPLAATLKSVVSTSGTQQAGSEGEVQSGTSGKTAAKDVGIGAGLGTVAGLIFGSALKGLAIGAIAGGGYVLATKGKDVELPANTGLMLSVDRAISLPTNTGGR